MSELLERIEKRLRKKNFMFPTGAMETILSILRDELGEKRDHTAGGLLKADPRPRCWFWYTEQQEPVAISPDRQWYDERGQINVIPADTVMIPLPRFPMDVDGE